jgi:hypothetical protein
MRGIRPFIVCFAVLATLFAGAFGAYNLFLLFLAIAGFIVVVVGLILRAGRRWAAGAKKEARTALLAAGIAAVVSVGLVAGAFNYYFGTPARLAEDTLIGKSVEEITGRLGKPDWDKRENDNFKGPEFHIVYYYGFGMLCLIEFDGNGVANHVGYGSK